MIGKLTGRIAGQYGDIVVITVSLIDGCHIDNTGDVTYYCLVIYNINFLLFGSYCDALILARYKEDKDLYRNICAMIAPRVATNKQSRALYLVFRDENNRFRFYGEENLKIYLIINGMFSV